MTPNAADTLVRLDAWLAAVDQALADGADPWAVLVHVLRVGCDLDAAVLAAGHAPVVRTDDLDAAYQPTFVLRGDWL